MVFRNVDSAQLRVLIRSRDFDLLLYPNLFVPLNTPGVGMALVYGSDAARNENGLDYGGIAHPAIDDALHTMIAAQDRQTVVDSMRAIDRVARWEYFSIPLNHSYPTPVGQLPISYWNKFGRPVHEQTWNFPYYSAETWWYDPAKAARLAHGVYAR